MAKKVTVPTATHCYLAYYKCGCCLSVVTDLEDKATQKDVADFIKRGAVKVERVTFEHYRENVKFGHQCELKKGPVRP